jgi:glycosyltransferase involved in cell wall biosynthesis
MKNRRILLLIPAPSALGGVTTYINIIKKEFTANVHYLIRGNRTYPFRKNKINNISRFVADLFVFFISLIFRRYKLIQTNTSFDRRGVSRDWFYIIISKLFLKKVIVFYHGWDHDYVNFIGRKHLKLFKAAFFRADAFVVLSSDFKNVLIKWGYTKPIYVETTIVDQELVKDISEEMIDRKYNQITDHISLLFLARIEKGKGIYTALEAYIILKQKYPELSMTIAGNGLELDNIKSEIEKKAIKDITVKGHVVKNEIAACFKSASLYILPSHTEGMPTSVLEAMSFGLPIISRPVGGLKDFFVNEKMGYLLESLEAKDFADCIDNLLQNREKMKEIALNNYCYAKDHFISNIVVKRIEKIYNQI